MQKEGVQTNGINGIQTVRRLSNHFVH